MKGKSAPPKALSTKGTSEMLISPSGNAGSKSARDLVGVAAKFLNLSSTAVTSVTTSTLLSGPGHGSEEQFSTTSPQIGLVTTRAGE